MDLQVLCELLWTSNAPRDNLAFYRTEKAIYTFLVDRAFCLMWLLLALVVNPTINQ